MNTPTTYTIGDTATWTESTEGLTSASDTLALVFAFADRFEVLDGVAEGDGYRFTLPDASVTLTPGEARVSLVANIGAARRVIENGTIRLIADPLATPTISANARILSAIDAVIEGRATSGEQNMQIGDRSIGLIPIPDLLTLRKTYAGLVRAEENQQLIALGISPKRKVSDVAFRL